MASSAIRAPLRFLILFFFVILDCRCAALGQTEVKAPTTQEAAQPVPQLQTVDAATSRYFNVTQGASSNDLVRRALSMNAELAAARLGIERSRARLRQAGLRPNPTFDFEQKTGALTGSNGERETTVGFALPLEINGQRQRRMDVAMAELEIAEAEIADRERRLAAEVRGTYAEVLAALRELEMTENLTSLDAQTARIVEARVTEGESAPLELSLLRTEAERLRARRALIEGRLQASLLRLKAVAGIPASEPLQVREDLTAMILQKPPDSVEAALDIALRSRPDLQVARLNEKAAEAGLRLAQAQAKPDVTAFTRYSSTRSVFDNTPVGVLRDKDQTVSFGVSISVPVFNKNQGAKAEAAIAITQAQRRREFAEQQVRAEVAAAYARYEATQVAAGIFEQGVLARTAENVRAIRGAYQLGAFRMTELLSEQRRLVDLQREYTETLAERYRALADLWSAVGISMTASEKKD